MGKKRVVATMGEAQSIKDGGATGGRERPPLRGYCGTQSGVGFAFFATLREIWVRTSCFARLRGAESTLPRVPRAALRLPGVRERPPLRSYCGTQSGVAFAESCGFWLLSATLSAIASMVVCKCRQLGQQMPATQIADRLNPHLGWEKGCRWSLACLTATGWRFSAI